MFFQLMVISLNQSCLSASIISLFFFIRISTSSSNFFSAKLLCFVLLHECRLSIFFRSWKVCSFVFLPFYLAGWQFGSYPKLLKSFDTILVYFFFYVVRASVLFSSFVSHKIWRIWVTTLVGTGLTTCGFSCNPKFVDPSCVELIYQVYGNSY